MLRDAANFPKAHFFGLKGSLNNANHKNRPIGKKLLKKLCEKQIYKERSLVFFCRSVSFSWPINIFDLLKRVRNPYYE